MTCATNCCICWPTILPLTMQPWDFHKDGSKSHCGSNKLISSSETEINLPYIMPVNGILNVNASTSSTKPTA